MLLFLVATIATATMFSLTETVFTIIFISLFSVSRFIAWAIFPYGRVVLARFAVLSLLSIITSILMTRERNARMKTQHLNEKMKDVILEKEKYFKLASEAQENERRRISRDLHDDSLQLLAVVMQQLNAAISATDPKVAQAHVLRAQETISETSDAIRRYCEELRPLLLDSLGLFAAVEWLGNDLANSKSINVTVDTFGKERRIKTQDNIHIFRVMQEAFHNIDKHSKATNVVVIWDHTGQDLEITVTDNGIGMWNFGPAPSRSLGIQGMYERMELVGGKLAIESQPGFGTKISLHVPFE